MFLGLLLPGLALADSDESAAKPDLQFTLTLEKEQFEAGEPVVAVVRITNLGATDYVAQTSTRPAGAFDGFAFTVTDATGQPVARPKVSLPEVHWIGSWNRVGRFETIERKIFLNYWFYPLAPGTYTLRGQYLPRTIESNQLLAWPPVASTPLQFRIVLPGETKLNIRIERLAEQVESGDPLAADFLGFTGDPYAIAPLIRALYTTDDQTRRHAANALNLILDQPAVHEAGLEALRDRGPNPTVVLWLHEHRLPADQLIPLYLRHAQAPDVAVRVGALTGLRLERTPARAATIRAAGLRALADPDSTVRIEAVRLLAGDPLARSALEKVAETDAHPRVRALAKEFLAVTPPANEKAELHR